MRRSVRYRHHAASGRLSPWAIAGICVGAAILLTVLIGNLLTIWLDDETYDRLISQKPESPKTEALFKTEVGNVNAYPYVFGDPLGDLLDLGAVSLSLNSPNGQLKYTSGVSSHQGIPSDGTELEKALPELIAYVPYVSGVYSVQAFRESMGELQFAVAAEESSLIREFLGLGAKEVILRDLPFETRSYAELAEYVALIKAAAGERGAIGVAIPFSVTQREDSWEIIGALLSVCDFCALDVTTVDTESTAPALSPEQLLKQAEYCLIQYDMRLLLSENQKALQDLIEVRLLPDYQIVSHEKSLS